MPDASEKPASPSSHPMTLPTEDVAALVAELRAFTEADAYATPWTFGEIIQRAATALSTLAGERDEARATPLQARLDAVEGQEPVYKAIERILDEHSAWISRPNHEVTKAIALAATIAAHEITKGMAAIDAVELQVQADEVALLKADKPQTWQGLDDARLQLAINAFYEPCEGTTIDGVRAAILAWEQSR